MDRGLLMGAGAPFWSLCPCRTRTRVVLPLLDPYNDCRLASNNVHALLMLKLDSWEYDLETFLFKKLVLLWWKNEEPIVFHRVYLCGSSWPWTNQILLWLRISVTYLYHCSPPFLSAPSSALPISDNAHALLMLNLAASYFWDHDLETLKWKKLRVISSCASP